MKLERFSFGLGDRFGQQGEAQLRAVIEAGNQGVVVAPVWNKSYREHTTIGTSPDDVRTEADAAVRNLDWSATYYVDADHISLNNVQLFLNASDFYTMDVADYIGHPASSDAIDSFADKFSKYISASSGVPGVHASGKVSMDDLKAIAAKYLLSVQEAGRIYRYIATAKGLENFVAEVSFDETDQPQSPVELFFILAALADEGVPVQTIAPKFSGRFNKGVDYDGDVSKFCKEFEDDLAVIEFAVREFGLPSNLKLSVHSGSDKFAIYAPIRETIEKHEAGLHVKTAGTTWLEEVIGLASAGGEGLLVAKEIYRRAYNDIGALTAPYAAVINIDTRELPEPNVVDEWNSSDFSAALTHDIECPAYNPHVRQLIHVGYKIAAHMGSRYLEAVRHHRTIIAAHVSENLLERHLMKIFPSNASATSLQTAPHEITKEARL